MAEASLTKRTTQYHLPEETRLALIRGSSDKPGATISPDLLAAVHRQRRRFIQLHGHDGFDNSAIDLE